MEEVMRYSHLLTFIGVTLLVCAISSPILAQTTFGAITGTVRDASGAVVPKVTIEATHVKSNYRYTVQSNESGNYTLPQLREGEYRLTVKAAGYKEYIANNILLAARDERRIDVVLQVGAVEATVEVSSGATLIETDTPRIGDTKDANQLKSLPLNTRSLYTFLALSPGVVGAGGGESFRRFAGSRRNQSDQSIDGISVSTGQDGTQITPLVQYVESFQEFRVDMANNSADIGSVGQVTLVSKSGTNDLHGSLFDYYVTPGFRARNPFTGTRSPSVGHNPGGSIGGPIVLPKLYNGHDKSFFFFSFETSRGSNTLDTLNPTVPIEAWRNGNFGNIPIHDPRLAGACTATDRTGCFPNNTIPEDRINPVSRKIQDRFYPLPNRGNTAAFASNNYREQLSRPFDPNTYWTTRVDHRFSDRAFMFGRYTWNRSFNRAFETVPNRGNDGLPTIGQLDRIRNTRATTVSFTYTISPNLVSESRWGLSFSNDPRQGPLRGREIVDFLGLQGLVSDLPDINGVPNIGFTGNFITTITQTPSRNPGFKNLTNQWQEHLNYYHGRHSLKGGLQIGRYQSVDYQQNNNLFGNITFSNRYTGQPYADFLLGLPTTVSRAFPAVQADRRRWGYDLFVTDDFKFSQRLTLNLGIRYELRPYWTEANGLLAVFDIDRGKIVVPDGSLSKVSPLMPRNYVDIIEANAAGLPGNTLVRTDRNNFAPRIGFALRPRGNDTVIRGGFGLFYDVVPRALTGGGVPYVINEPNFTNPSGNPSVILPNVFPATGVAGPSTINLPQAINPDLSIPYSMQYNLTVEHQKWNTGFRLSYIGTNTRQGDFTININQPVPDTRPFASKPRPFPRYPAINYRTNGAGHQYHSLTAEVERRLVKGLAYQASWTWARDIGDLTGFLEDTPGFVLENAFDRGRERGVSFDLPRHRVTGNVIYDFPFGQGRRFFGGARRRLNSVIGGWQSSVIFSYYSGQFLTPLWSGPDPTGTMFTSSSTPANVTIRPDILHDPNLPSSQRTADRWFDPTAFGPPQPGQFGTSSRGVIEGPGTTVFHAGLAKQFNFSESMRLRFELTATNVFNHTNFSNPGLDISTPASIGKITNSVIDSDLDQSGARSLRAGLRFEW
jgi:carboxypeptidase family protein